MARSPGGPPPTPVVQRLRVRYARRGRMRFTSHRDFARALERALRRAAVPVGFSAGFSPHPKVSYLGAVPTGAASEAEYLEIGLAARRAPGTVGEALDAALPPGLDIVEVVQARIGAGSLAERIDTSEWVLRLPGVDDAELGHAVGAFLHAGEVTVERVTREGRRRLDARACVVRLECVEPDTDHGCAILRAVVRHGSPAVRPDDVLAGLRVVAGLVPPSPPLATRLAQGLLDPSTGRLADPLAPDREHAAVDEVVGA
ncbi:MAG TPA: TIGR03936 family radical SAM-associated protein [Mycobacteriales bacterium]|nr:TIGR03936 family radical SAM-associated protein [Mycobacteriales bacterium]